MVAEDVFFVAENISFLFLNDVTFLSRVARVDSLSVRKLSLVQLWTKRSYILFETFNAPKKRIICDTSCSRDTLAYVSFHF